MSRAKVIALQTPSVPEVPDYDEQFKSMEFAIQYLGKVIENLKLDIDELKRKDTSKLEERITSLEKKLSVDSMAKAIKALEDRINESERLRRETKLSVTFDVLTDAAGDIRQIVARET